MNTPTDKELLERYAAQRSEPAFAELVRRHIDFVHSCAVRLVRDAHLAQDVTQNVFVALAANAHSLARHPVLAGWLHRTARNIAIQIVRTESRRRAREQNAAAMKDLLTHGTDAVWDHIVPHLDAGLDELNDSDRDVLLLRYFDKKTAGQMAALLGISEDAAQKRVGRALDRLRDYLSKNNVALGAGALAMLITAKAVQAAPATLAAGISAGVLSGTLVPHAAIHATAMTILQKSIVTLALAVSVGAVAFEAHQAAHWRSENRVLTEQLGQAAAAAEPASAPAPATGSERLPDAQFRELLRLRGEVGLLRKQTAGVQALREENQRLRAAEQTAVKTRTGEKAAENEQAHIREQVNNAKQGLLAVTMALNDNQDHYPTNLSEITRYASADLMQTISNNFDLMILGPLNTVTNPAETLILVQKQPEQTSAGNWSKVYGFADGHVLVQTSPDGDFSQWEAARTYRPAQ